MSAEIGDGDCDVGVGALEAVNVELADSLGRRSRTGWTGCLARWRRRREARGEFDSPAYAVNARPVLTGRRPDGRLTLSQQGCALGLVSVQLELSMRLRRALVGDRAGDGGFRLRDRRRLRESRAIRHGSGREDVRGHRGAR